MRPFELHQANRRVSPPTDELTRSVSHVQLGSLLPFTAVVLTVCVLAFAGCTTETPPVRLPCRVPD